MKKLFLLFTASLLPLVINAFTGDVEIDGIYYNIVTKGKVAVVISKPIGEYSGIVKIPSSVTYDGVECSVTSIGDWAFSGSRDLISVSVPNSVTTIGSYSFNGCTSMTSVSLGNNLTTISNCAFSNCSALTTIIIPSSVTSIKSYAFVNCSGLTTISIPNSITSIEDFTFRDCRSLTSISLPQNITRINRDAFRGCTGLKAVYISDLEAWCKIVFDGRESNPLYYAHHLILNGEEIKELQIPNGTTSINGYAFVGCSGLTSVKFPESLDTIGYYAFEECNGLTSVTISNGLSVIKQSAFYGCKGLKTVMIGSGTEKIYSQAFASCEDLADVYCLAENVPMTCNTYGSSPSSDAFNGSYIEYATLHVPEESIDKYKMAEPWKNFKDIVKVMPFHTLTYIVDGNTYKSYQIEENATITMEPIPNKEGYTFNGWSEFPETMPAHDVIVIGTYSINNYKLTYIVDSEEYKSYEINYGTNITAEVDPTKVGHTFSGWSGVPETMPAHDVTVTGSFSVNSYTLTYMVDGEVYKTYEIKYGTTLIPKETPTKTGYTFSGWGDIPSTMPAKDVILSGTFSINSYKLTYVVDGEVYKTVEVDYNSLISPEAEPTKEGHTFSGWSEIPETMPANDITIYGSFTPLKCGENLFWNFSEETKTLRIFGTGDMWNYEINWQVKNPSPWNDIKSEIKNIIIEEGVSSIGNYAFCHCDNATKIALPQSLSTIGHNAFMECYSLTSIEIPDYVTIINDQVFSYCTGLKTILWGKNVTTIGSYSFWHCEALSSLDIQDGVLTIGSDAFSGCISLTSIKLPKSITSIGGWAFGGCNNIENVISLIAEPFPFSSDVFSDKTYTNATLHVPAAYINGKF